MSKNSPIQTYNQVFFWMKDLKHKKKKEDVNKGNRTGYKGNRRNRKF